MNEEGERRKIQQTREEIPKHNPREIRPRIWRERRSIDNNKFQLEEIQIHEQSTNIKPVQQLEGYKVWNMQRTRKRTQPIERVLLGRERYKEEYIRGTN